MLSPFCAKRLSAGLNQNLVDRSWWADYYGLVLTGLWPLGRAAIHLNQPSGERTKP